LERLLHVGAELILDRLDLRFLVSGELQFLGHIFSGYSGCTATAEHATATHTAAAKSATTTALSAALPWATCSTLRTGDGWNDKRSRKYCNKYLRVHYWYLQDFRRASGFLVAPSRREI
jgi:hypothetical protein